MSEQLDLGVMSPFVTLEMPEFKRDTRGSPWVDHPTETTKNGRRRRVRYRRTSSFGRQILDDYLLHRRDELFVLLGAARLRQLELDVISGLDPNDPATAEALYLAVDEAKVGAGVWYAADRGTWVHSITECVDRGTTISPELYAEGERFGFTFADANRFADWWGDLLEANGLRVVAVEARCVNDEFNCAGTLDRLVELRRPLQFNFEVIPAGSVVVLDAKTSALHLASGSPSYWASYAPQVYLYAASVPYLANPDGLDARLTWPWTVDQRHGLIAHVNMSRDEGTVGAMSLWRVDLEAGRHAVELTVAAQEYEARRDLFMRCGVAL